VRCTSCVHSLCFLVIRPASRSTGFPYTTLFRSLAQVVAGVFPGTSRSAAAIFMAMLLGMNRKPAAAEFVFLVGIPTMFAATGHAAMETVLDGHAGDADWAGMALAFVAATVAGFATVRWLLRYIGTHRFTPFAWYRIGLGAALLLGLPAGGCSRRHVAVLLDGIAQRMHRRLEHLELVREGLAVVAPVAGLEARLARTRRRRRQQLGLEVHAQH